MVGPAPLERRSIFHMSRIVGAAAAQLRLALAFVFSGAVALLTPSLGTTVDAPSTAVLVAVAVAVAAAVVLSSHLATSVLPGVLAQQLRTTDEAPTVRPGRVTDPRHHPLRPRAPGLV
jgi:hypothetical protein